LTNILALTIPDDAGVLAAVGKIALRHGQLDYILRMTIKTISGVGFRPALDATRRNGSRELRERIRKLARKRIGEGASLLRLEAFLERASQVTERRNELLHSLWAYDMDRNPVIRDDAHRIQAIPAIAELEALAEAIRAVTAELNYERLEGFIKAELERAGNAASDIPEVQAPNQEGAAAGAGNAGA